MGLVAVNTLQGSLVKVRSSYRTVYTRAENICSTCIGDQQCCRTTDHFYIQYKICQQLTRHTTNSKRVKLTMCQVDEMTRV